MDSEKDASDSGSRSTGNPPTAPLDLNKSLMMDQSSPAKVSIRQDTTSYNSESLLDKTRVGIHGIDLEDGHHHKRLTVSRDNASVPERTIQQYNARQIGGGSGINTTLDGLRLSGFPGQQIVESTMGPSSGKIQSVSQYDNDMADSGISAVDQQYNSFMPSTSQISSSSFHNSQDGVGIGHQSVGTFQQTLGNTGQAVRADYNKYGVRDHNLQGDTIDLNFFPQIGGGFSNAMTASTPHKFFNQGGIPGSNDIMQNALQRIGFQRREGSGNIISSHLDSANQFDVQGERSFYPQFGTIGTGQEVPAESDSRNLWRFQQTAENASKFGVHSERSFHPQLGTANIAQRVPLELESRNTRILQQAVENTRQPLHTNHNYTTASNLFNINQGEFASSSGMMQNSLQRLASQGLHDSRNTVTNHIGDARQFDLPSGRYLIPQFGANTTSGYRQNILTGHTNIDGSLLSLGPVTTAGHQSYGNNQAGSTYADWNQQRPGVGISGSIPNYYYGEDLRHVNARMNASQPGGWQRPFLHYPEPGPQGINSASFNSFGQWQAPHMQGIPPLQPLSLGPNGSNHVVQTSSIGRSVPWVQSGLTNLASLVHSSNAIPPTPFASGQDAQAAITFGSNSDARRGPAASNIGVPVAQAPPAQANKRKSPSGPQEGLAAARVTRSRAQKDKGGGPSFEPGSSKPVGLDILDKGKAIAPSMNQNTQLGTDWNKLQKKPISSAHATDTLNMPELKDALSAFTDNRRLTQQQTDQILQFQKLLQLRQTQLPQKTVDHIKAEDFFADSTELFGERCQLCKLDLKFSPDGSRNSDSGPSVHAVLPCGHCYHYSCLLDVFGPLQPGEDPTCIQCLEGGAKSAN